MEREETYNFCKKLMALPYLPSDSIPGLFAHLQGTATTDGLVQLCQYISSTWAVRTNNDLEGWHRRLNHSAGKSNLPMYLLVQLLGDESRLANFQVRLLSDEKLRRRQKKDTLRFQGRLFGVWDRHAAGEMSARKALRKISRMLADF
uniref:Uncharacterized protein LOC111112335 n=1 Tax=Crassostrea virginica TaxID=6565 RepID=A0A8B8BRD2_CRAVI|nr:uncharacterized protein LOC111112335 [Crassostrea virginica]